MLTLYYHSRCSKCRAAVAILEASQIPFTVVEYLLTPLSAVDLDDLLKQLGMQPEEMVRKGEELYEDLEKKNLLPSTHHEWLKLLERNPILIERPIVSDGVSAVIGRPPEKISEWLEARKKQR